jgi:hypothetical protein
MKSLTHRAIRKAYKQFQGRRVCSVLKLDLFTARFAVGRQARSGLLAADRWPSI